MADFKVEAETVVTVKSVTLTLSQREAASLMHLLYVGVGGSAIGSGGDLGKILHALKAAFGKDKYSMISQEIRKYSGVAISEGDGHCPVASIREGDEIGDILT